jgi:ssDNA-binding replication factor A large subunit
MSTEQIIQQILQQRPEAQREQILQKLSAAKEKTNGLIAEETLLRLIAAEFGVETAQKNARHDHKLSIGHLVSGLNDVTVTGRVMAVYPVKTFEGAKPGKYAAVIVVDKDGLLRVLLWNEHADAVESGELKVGQIARFSHGYTKEDRNGAVELHLGSRSEVEFNPSDENEDDYPSTIGRFTVKISALTTARRLVNLEGSVKRVCSLSAFTRQDQTTGTVLRFVLTDETGEVPVVVWNEKALELEHSVKENAAVQLINGRVKVGASGEIEVHVEASTHVQISAAPRRLTSISVLNEGLGSVDVEGEVSTVPVAREVSTSKGETVKLCTFELRDETGAVWVSAWRQHAETAGALVMGDKVLLRNAYVRRGFDGRKELSTRATTSITRV